MNKIDLENLYSEFTDKYNDLISVLYTMRSAVEGNNKQFPFIAGDCTYVIEALENLWDDEVGDLRGDIEDLPETGDLTESVLETSLFTSPTPNSASGVSSVLIDILNKKYNDIDTLNSAKVTLEAENYGEMLPVLDSVLEDENNSVGKIQELLNLISPQSDEFDKGKADAIALLDEE